MSGNLGELVIVEPGPSQSPFFQFEPERSNQMQGGACIGTKAYDVTGVRWNFRLIENHAEHDEHHPTTDPTTHSMALANSPAPDAIASKFCGLDFYSPIVLLSGCVGFGEEYTRVSGFSNADVGAIVLKGTTREPRLGNSPHRIYETPMGMLNAIGLQNPGAEKVVDEILPTLDFSETRFIANVCGSTIEDYAAVTRRFDDSPIDAIEINISCPNIKEGGVQFGNYPEMSAAVVAACRKATKKPIIAKLSPNQTDIRENARLCIEAGSDALAVINTITGMAIDIESRTPVIGNIQGGLSGPAIRPIALLKVHQVYEVARRNAIPIIGQGGIHTAGDALEFIIAGASAVGIGTALFYDPLLCPRINDGIRAYLRRKEVASITELVGTLKID